MECKIGEIAQSISDTFDFSAHPKFVLINTSDIESGFVQNHAKLAHEDIKGQFKKSFKKHDLLYSEIRPANRRFAFIDFESDDYVASTKLMVIRCDKEKVRSRYLYHYLTSNQIIAYLQMMAESRSGTFPQITFQEIAQIDLDLPSLDIQDKVVEIIDSIESKVQLNNKLNDYLAELVSLEFEARFADGCPCVELGEVLSISTRSIKPKDHLGEVWEHYSIPAFDETHWPVFELADEIKSNKYIVDRNNILISKLNPSIKRIWIPVCVSNTAVCSTEFIVYKANNPKHKSFYNAAINAPAFTEFLLEHVTGSTGSRQRTQPKATLEYSIPNPPDTEIEAFCGYADPIYAQIKSNELESQALSSLRDLLLPKLMSGEIDISNIDITQLNNHLSDC